MAKGKPGLPESFEFNVETPVELGDYLDDDLKELTVESHNQPRTSTAANEKRKKLDSDDTTPSRSQPIKSGVEPPRKQINMTPETLRKVEELLDIVRERGPQRNAASSEMFDALISTLHEARDSIDLSGVPSRGRWGTATAAAFITALSLAFAVAIAESSK